jgi:hypothetical protein
MSSRERDRLKVLSQVVCGHVSCSDGSRLVGLSVRHFRRLLRRYESEGDSGLVHGLRGRPSNRGVSESMRSKAVGLLGDRYAGFGPTLASEKLSSEHGIVLSRETVRQLMIKEGLWKPRRGRVRHRRWRARRECFGELVQIDTSEHDWFEGRGESCVLLGMIDDATSRVYLQFFESDTSLANMTVIRDWIRLQGRPLGIYGDKASHFVTNRSTTVEEDLSGIESETQIGRALRELEIEYITAHSPQAKGRVERLFGTCQDRLVKELRLREIGTMSEANAFVVEEFLPMWQKRFSRDPVSPVDAHRSRKGFDLSAILSHQEERVVCNDYTVRYQTRVYQIRRKSVKPGLRRSRVVVEERLDGTTRIRWQGKYLSHARIAQPEAGSSVGLVPPSAPASPRKPGREATGWKPGPDHPWRRFKIGKQDRPANHP